MNNEVLERLVNFVRSIAKDCDNCPHKATSRCLGCIGEQAKTLMRDVDFVPCADKSEQDNVLLVMSKVDVGRWTVIKEIVSDTGLDSRTVRRILSTLESENVVEVKDNRWTKRK